MKKFNWQIWAGVLLSIVSFLSYPLVFVNWAVTRDFPWANILLFVIAAIFLFIGLRRAFAPGRRLISKITAPILAALSVLIFAGFIFVAFIAARWLPPSLGAPQVGQKAPEFTLNDTNNKPTSLADLLSAPIESAGASRAPKGALLIFYRGYW